MNEAPKPEDAVSRRHFLFSASWPSDQGQKTKAERAYEMALAADLTFD